MEINNTLNDLTVVVKTFLRYDALDECIKNIRNIDNNLKIVVIDDTPLDHRQYPDYDENVTIHQAPEDLGISAGRNLGFTLAENDYILYCDDDMIIQNTADEIFQHLNLVKGGFCDMVGSRGAMIEENDGVVISRNIKPNYLSKVDILANYFISSKEFLTKNGFPTHLKCNEHLAYFYDLKRKNKLLFSSPIMKFKDLHTRNDEYKKYRNRNYIKEACEFMGIKSFKWV
jgi:glycosyltransferase involved in cell wall biosynthesis